MIIFQLEQGITDQTIHDTIDGTPVTLRFLWNERFKYWTVSIYDRQQEAISLGIKMVRSYPLISRLNLDSIEGEFYFFRQNGSKEEADIDSLGGDFTFVYLTSEENGIIQQSI